MVGVVEVSISLILLTWFSFRALRLNLFLVIMFWETKERCIQEFLTGLWNGIAANGG
jgi:hypothetical protein